MTLSELPSGAKVYIDANIFIYHFTGHSDAATGFPQRCEESDLHGVTGTVVLLEVSHRLMALEALQSGLVTGKNMARRISAGPRVALLPTRSRRLVGG